MSALDDRPYEYVENGTLWLRMRPDETVTDFVKRAARARGPLTDTEKVQLRDVFAPTPGEAGRDAA